MSMAQNIGEEKIIYFWIQYNLVPRVTRFSGQGLVTRRDSAELQFYYRRISAAKQCKLFTGSQSKNFKLFEFSRVSPDDQPLAKEPEDSGYKIGCNTQCFKPAQVVKIAKTWESDYSWQYM